ncbi:hypothetical protein BD560DRAFT_433978 [Blakeslea trispora]|nr:hypothetical protein BD560DRAFT_433978 [Blakeslea trispora]
MTQTYKDIQTPLTTLVNESGKNAADVLCPKPTCNCIILRKNTGTLIEGDGSKLTLPSSSLTATDLPEGNDTHFWRMTSMMDFENVGFSTTHSES